MPPVLRSIFGRLNLTLLAIAIICATFWFTDHTTNRHPAAPRIVPAEVTARRAARSERPKVFVLILDSLRYETATNPEIMPNLCALVHEGAYAKVSAGFNSSTAPALRDIFTGRENAAVLAVVSTFLKSDAGMESLFHQLSLAGIYSATYGIDYFLQFGAGLTYTSVIGARTPREIDDGNVLKGAQALRSGEYDFVVGHLNYTDYAAHDFGIFRKEYRENFQRADALIPRIRALLPPGSTFVVTGDHGHDVTGKHGFGMDVPTVAAYVGPAFRVGQNLGTITITSHRYLMSHAAGVPLNAEGYTGMYLPQALNAQHDHLEWLLAQVQAARWEKLTRTWIVWIYLSMLAALWFNLACRDYSPLQFRGGATILPWFLISPLLLPGVWPTVAGMLVVAALVLRLGRGSPPVKIIQWVIVPIVLALGFQQWGRVLMLVRAAAESISGETLLAAWVVVAGLGALVVTRSRRTWVMGVVTAAALLMGYPTNERHGFPAMLSPLVLCWYVFFAVSLGRDGALAPRRAKLEVLLGGLGVFFLIQPFTIVSSVDGNFSHWGAIIPALGVTNVVYFGLMVVIAKAILFFPAWPGAWRAAMTTGIILLLVIIESRSHVPNAYVTIAMLTTILVAWYFVGHRWRRPEGRVLLLTFWFLLYYYWVALTPRNFAEIGCMIAALVLCARLAARHAQAENLRMDYLIFATLGLVVTGWAAMRWTTAELEWHAAYEWFSAPTVERRAGFFVPWIVLKGLIPWVIVVLGLRQELGTQEKFPARLLLCVFAAKLMTMLMLNTGLGGADTLNQSYLEAACVTGVLAVLLAGVVLHPRAWTSNGLAVQPSR